MIEIIIRIQKSNVVEDYNYDPPARTEESNEKLDSLIKSKIIINIMNNYPKVLLSYQLVEYVENAIDAILYIDGEPGTTGDEATIASECKEIRNECFNDFDSWRVTI